MQITSSAFSNNGIIPKKYTCQGENINPQIQIVEATPEAKSLALIVNDPDAPSRDFVHWIVWNIDPTTEKIMEDSTAMGATEGINDAGKVGYTGPCPPSGKHRYEFHLYALDCILDLTSSGKDYFREKIAGHIIEEATLIGFYEKS